MMHSDFSTPSDASAMTLHYSERVVLCGAEGNMVGVHCAPAKPSNGASSDVAVIFLNAGLIHRAGPGRLYVRLARFLAHRGIASMRLDFSSLGDSPPRRGAIPLLQLAAQEPSEAVDFLEKQGHTKFILVGICSGAFAAFSSIRADARIAGAALVNPQELAEIGGDESESRARRYLTKSIFSGKAWRNLLTGKIKYKRLFSTFARRAVALVKPSPSKGGGQNKSALDILRDDMTAVLGRGGRMFFLLSESDISVEHIARVREGLADDISAKIDYREVSGAEHLFTRPQDKSVVEDALAKWITTV